MTTTTAITSSKNNLSTDAVDREIQEIVSEFKAGTRPEESARGAILVLLQNTGILAQVSRGPKVREHEQEPLETSLRDLMIEKVLTPNGDKNFSLNLIDGKSGCGWYRKFATTARDSELRNLRSASNRFGVPIDVTTVGGAPGSDPHTHGANLDTPWATNANLHRSTDEILHEESTAQLTDSFIKKARYLRGDRIPQVQADYLMRFFNLPSAARPAQPTDRAFVMKTLSKDSKAAYRSASVAFQLRVGDIVEGEVSTDPRLIEIWRNQSTSSLNTLLDSPGKVAHTIALAATMPRPRPSSVSLDRFRRMVQAASALSEWTEIAETLANAYIATEFTALSSYVEHRLDDDETAEIEATHSENFKRWPDVALQASSFVGAPLGKDVETVRQTLETYAIGAKAIETGAHAD